MKIAIFGVGGVGGYFGGRLTQTDHDVYFIARGKHLAAIREGGLKVQQDAETFVAHPTLATDDPAEVGEVDVVIMATKAWQVREAAEAMRPMMGEHTFVIPLLNGVEAPAHIADVLGESRALGGFCRILSYIEAPGHVVQAGPSPDLAFGELDNSETERVRQMRAVFAQAAIRVQDTPDIQAAMWQKMLFISSFSGVGALTRAPADVLRSVPAVKQMLQAAMQEVYDVATARGINMADDAVEKAMYAIERLPEGTTASMQRDVMDGRPSELEAQNGAVVRLGMEAGIDTPLHKFIYTSLLPMEMKARGQL